MIVAHGFRFRMILAGSFLAALLGAAEAARCSDDLVYVPLTPCKVIDTRVPGAGGPLVGGKPRSFVLRGPRRNYQSPAPFPNQGGKTTGCGVPDLAGGSGGKRENVARAVAVTAELDTGAREVKVWPANAGEPDASRLAKFAELEGQIVPMCDEVASEPCAGGDITFQAKTDRHLVVDVVGYFREPSTPRAPSAGAHGTQAPRGTGAGIARDSRESKDMALLRKIGRLGVTLYYPRTVPARFKLTEARAHMAGENQYVEYQLTYCDQKDLCFSIESAYGEIGDVDGDRQLSGKSKIFGPFNVYVIPPRGEGNDTPDTYYLSDWLVQPTRKHPKHGLPKDSKYYHLLGSGLEDKEAVAIVQSLAAWQ